MTPERMCVSSKALIRSSEPRGSELDLHIHARGEVELHQRVHGLRSGVYDIEHALVGAHLELLARLLVDVRRAVHRIALDARRKRDRTPHLRARPLRRRNDFARRGVEDPVIERLEANADVLTVHGLTRLRERTRPAESSRAVSSSFLIPRSRRQRRRRPCVPSRMAKRSFSSMAIGTISVTSMVTLSPGITISVPSGSVTTPVTSVVRK